MADKPLWQIIFISLIVISNIFLNILLIPIFSINGAAFATAISFNLYILFEKTIKKNIRYKNLIFIKSCISKYIFQES